MYRAPVRMKCKGSAECSMLCKNLKPEFNHLHSAIQNLSCTHDCTHSDPTPSTAADSQQTCFQPAKYY